MAAWQEVKNRKTQGRKQIWTNLRYNSIICLEGLRKPQENFSEENLGPSPDSHRAPTEYKSEAMPLQPICFDMLMYCDSITLQFYQLCNCKMKARRRLQLSREVRKFSPKFRCGTSLTVHIFSIVLDPLPKL